MQEFEKELWNAFKSNKVAPANAEALFKEDGNPEMRGSASLQTNITNSDLVWWRDRGSGGVGTQPRRRLSEPRLSEVEYATGRGQWGHKAEFLLSCVGLSVGLGNVWRFPYLAYENGGAAFVMAYLILQLLVGKPMYMMELSLGQFSGKGPTRLWDMSPAAKGIGLAMCVVSLITAIYYNVIMAYTLDFFFASMTDEMPWTICKDEWVKEYNCVKKRWPICTEDTETMKSHGVCTCSGNVTIDGALPFSCTPKIENPTTAAELYFYKTVIKRSEGIEPENLGTPIPMLALYLGLSWIVVIFCLIKGIKSSGKVVYFTATFPYVILITLLVRGCLLDGAIDGVKYFLVPEWGKLLNLNVWVAAAGQMFFSLSIGFGGLIMFGSYNKFDNEVYSDAMLIASLDLLTSMIGGLVVFTTFGAMAKTIGTTIDKVAKSGYGLAFVVYPEALTHMAPTQLWSILFFFMLFTLGLDSEFAFMETVLTCVQDEFPKLRAHKSLICVVLGCTCFLLGLPGICPGGDYVVTIMDHYGPEFCLLFLGGFECIAVSWVYGINHFMQDLEYMLGKRPHVWPYWAFCWAVSCPLIICSLFMYRMADYTPPKYPTGEPFPKLAQGLGWGLSAVALSPVLIWFVILLVKSYSMPEITTNRERLEFLFSPTRKWKPNDGRSLAPTRQPSRQPSTV